MTAGTETVVSETVVSSGLKQLSVMTAGTETVVSETVVSTGL